MEQIRLGAIEARFADIVWDNEPVKTRDLVSLCAEALNWKRTTTYTVLKKLCERGIFVTENSTVRSIISRSEFYSIQSEKFVDEAFSGSLPSFIASFTARKKPTAEEIREIREMIDMFDEE